MRVAAELRAIDMRSSHQFEEEIGNASSVNLALIHKTEFSIRTIEIIIAFSRDQGQQEGLHRAIYQAVVSLATPHPVMKIGKEFY
jgi:hypothetical protein